MILTIILNIVAVIRRNTSKINNRRNTRKHVRKQPNGHNKFNITNE